MEAVGSETDRGDLPTSQRADGELARRIADGDTAAWGRFFDRFHPWAYRFAYTHLAGNAAEADDLCSDIMITAARAIGRFDPDRGTLDVWLLGLARHRLAHHFRRRRRQPPAVPDLADDLAPDLPLAEVADRLSAGEVVNRALSVLPARQADLLIGKYVAGYTVEELARLHDTTPKAIDSLLARARSGFRAAYRALLETSEGGGHE